MATVLIDLDGKIVNSDRVKKVRSKENEDVRWVAMGNGGPWKITFDKVTSPSAYPIAVGSPFTQTEYTVVQGGSGGSTGGPVAGMIGWTYKYNVRNTNNNNITDDPDVDIE